MPAVQEQRVFGRLAMQDHGTITHGLIVIPTNKPIQLDNSSRTHGDCTTCSAMSRNGVKIGSMNAITPIVRRRIHKGRLVGKLMWCVEGIIRTVSFGAVQRVAYSSLLMFVPTTPGCVWRVRFEGAEAGKPSGTFKVSDGLEWLKRKENAS